MRAQDEAVLVAVLNNQIDDARRLLAGMTEAERQHLWAGSTMLAALLGGDIDRDAVDKAAEILGR